MEILELLGTDGMIDLLGFLFNSTRYSSHLPAGSDRHGLVSDEAPNDIDGVLLLR